MKFDLTICGTQHIQIACEVAYEAQKMPTHYKFESYDDGATALFIFCRPVPNAIQLPYSMTEAAHLSLFVAGWAQREPHHGENEYGFHEPTVRGYRATNAPCYNYEDSGFNQTDIFIAFEPVYVRL